MKDLRRLWRYLNSQDTAKKTFIWTFYDGLSIHIIFSDMSITLSLHLIQTTILFSWMNKNVTLFIPWQQLFSCQQNHLKQLFNSVAAETFISTFSNCIKKMTNQSKTILDSVISPICSHFNIYILSKEPSDEDSFVGMILPLGLVEITRTGWFSLALGDYMLAGLGHSTAGLYTISFLL